jgi:hypothetical protein
MGHLEFKAGKAGSSAPEYLGGGGGGEKWGGGGGEEFNQCVMTPSSGKV